jgi:hypothetical protein
MRLSENYKNCQEPGITGRTSYGPMIPVLIKTEEPHPTDLQFSGKNGVLFQFKEIPYAEIQNSTCGDRKQDVQLPRAKC